MSYQIVDEAGKGFDFSTNGGLINLRAKAGRALSEFLELGEADETLWHRVMAECDGIPDLDYINKLFRKCEPPITLTQGCS